MRHDTFKCDMTLRHDAFICDMTDACQARDSAIQQTFPSRRLATFWASVTRPVSVRRHSFKCMRHDENATRTSSAIPKTIDCSANDLKLRQLVVDRHQAAADLVASESIQGYLSISLAAAELDVISWKTDELCV